MKELLTKDHPLKEHQFYLKIKPIRGTINRDSGHSHTDLNVLTCPLMCNGHAKFKK